MYWDNNARLDYLIYCLSNVVTTKGLYFSGNVKQNDLNSYPPYGYQSPQPISQRFPSPVMSNNLPAVSSTKYTTSYNNHAKKGFKYWYEEKKGLPGG